MKRIIIMLMVTILAISVMAQDKNKSLDLGHYVSTDITFNSSVDTIGASDTYEVQFLANKAEAVKYDVRLDVSKVSGSPEVKAVLRGKIFPDDTYTRVDSVTWYATTADSTLRFQQHTTAQYYRYFDILFESTSTAQKSTVDNVDIKFWP